jgi:peptidoglycan/xylan/chitin deacetylase (PgdA/CDA1 family)
MQRIKAWGLASCLAVGVLQPAAAQQSCVPGPNALGVSRTVEIDTSTGPRFGFQYPEHSFLNDGEVVLTFDDGPLRAYTRPVLEALAAHCTKATFFVVGRMAVADPEMVQEYDRRGHTIGTHTWSHAKLAALTPLRARAEIELGFSAVQQALGKPLAPFFRFPYLSDSKSLLIHLQNRQMGAFSIDIDSKDFRTRDPGSVHRKVMADLARQRKGIILFHDIQPSTARALPGLLAELKAKGYRVVHIRPKASAATVAEFDAQAQQELAKRQRTVVAQPLAKRSLTWPIAKGGLPVQPTAAGPAEAQQAPGATPPQPPKAAPRPPRSTASDDWFSNIWR